MIPENQNKNVLVGIVTFNRKEKLINTLSECERQGFQDIVVLDNSSNDGTREYLQNRKGLKLILCETNLGGSGGINAIMHFFLESCEHDWLLLFDDDAYPAFSYERLSRYLNAEDDRSRPAYTFKVTYPDGTLCKMNRPGRNILSRNPLRALAGDFHIQSSTTTCDVDFASFVGLLLKKETIERIGVVSPQFFIYSDDTYYTLSISSSLGKIRFCSEFVFVHDCNRSSRALSNHGPTRLERDVINKTVMIREYSRFSRVYLAAYVVRLILANPLLSPAILRAFRKGLSASLASYRNEAVGLQVKA